MLFNQLLDMPHLSGGWIILAREKMLINSGVIKFVHTSERSNSLCIEHFWDLLCQLMKHGTSTLHIMFIYLFSVDSERVGERLKEGYGVL